MVCPHRIFICLVHPQAARTYAGNNFGHRLLDVLVATIPEQLRGCVSTILFLGSAIFEMYSATSYSVMPDVDVSEIFLDLGRVLVSLRKVFPSPVFLYSTLSQLVFGGWRC